MNLRSIGSFPSWCRLSKTWEWVLVETGVWPWFWGWGSTHKSILIKLQYRSRGRPWISTTFPTWVLDAKETWKDRSPWEGWVRLPPRVSILTEKLQSKCNLNGSAFDVCCRVHYRWNGEDLACGGDEDDLSGCLVSKIIWLVMKGLSKERFLHGNRVTILYRWHWAPLPKRYLDVHEQPELVRKSKPSSHERLSQRGQTCESFTSILAHSKNLHDHFESGEVEIWGMINWFWKQTMVGRVGTQQQWCQRDKRVVQHRKAS